MFNFNVENEAYEGVKKIAQKAAKDFEKVFGEKPNNTHNFIFATLGKSPIVDNLIKEGKFDSSNISGKREVYQIKILDDKTLLICGSDKRGTIYGIFALCEYIGVSPLHFWGDIEPVRREKLEINKDIETISKEPSVKYRGFFINDEWPCFGTWTWTRFGGFTAEMYDHVFELLLRLKGNYLWPAMWTSSFALDGPGNLNEELADTYGVIIGASHHEPCLRASEEWGKVMGQDSKYGNEWNYYTNKEGLINYWEDGLKRSGKYEKIITIGMRGERDSSMLGDNSTVKENVDLLKDIIKNQRQLIKNNVNSNLNEVPQLLALYKEVEEYFYGSKDAKGLKYWDELDGVICMLCEDNFGFMRTLPTQDIRNRKGGFGMYYHFDYHGGPISYEWMPSTSFERTWEQMCMAYDYGINEIWIVNVGDLKFNEVPLAYFLTLAYDFENWGTNSPNSIDKYTAQWLEKTFPAVNAQIREKMAEVLHGYIRMNAMRRPEALNANIYHSCHYLEADKMLELAAKIEVSNEEIYTALNENEKNAFYSMIYIPAKASINLLRMHIYSGKNALYARQGRKTANKYADLVTQCIDTDKKLMQDFGNFKNGKWKGMELGQHIGFVTWNEDNYRNPLRVLVEPAYKPRLSVTRKDREEVYSKTYGNPMTIIVNDFLYEGNEKVIIEVANDGIDTLDYVIEQETPCDWLKISQVKGCVEYQDDIELSVVPQKLTNEIQTTKLLIKTKDTVVAVNVNAKNTDKSQLPQNTHLQNKGIIVIPANKYCNKIDLPLGAFCELVNYGRSGTGMKVFPTTVNFAEKKDRPSLSYRFLIEDAGEYIIEAWTTPTNSVEINKPLRFMLSGGNKKQIVTTIPANFKAGNNSDKRWFYGVLDNIRKTKSKLKLKKGVQEISIGAMEPGLVLEKILIYREISPPLPSYLGP
ncbi:MAG: glycosyl hydrolase 115 family protein [Treponema sp.]|jgi:hypothetical protein|nr:glycosyl hydrolase 115 family protein [Treponema sp.]